MFSARLFGTPTPVHLFMVFAFTAACADRNLLKNQAEETGEALESGDVVDLVSFDAWAILEASEDPYPGHRTENHTCSPRGVLAEEDVLEVNTNDCGYAVLGQPLSADIEAGDWIELMMYHSALASVDEPAEGHFSLWVGDNLFWERTIAIPAAPEIYPVPMPVTWSASAGEQVRIHLHNHGGNSWRVAYLKRLRGEAVPSR